MLARSFTYITDLLVMTMYELSLAFPAHELLMPDVGDLVLAQAREQMQAYSGGGEKQ